MSTWEDTKHHLAFRDIKLNTTGSYCSHPLQRRWPRRQTMTSVDKDVHKLCLSNCCSECNAHWKMTWEFLKMFNRGRPLAWQLRCEGLGSIPGRVPPSADPGRQQSQVWLPHGQPRPHSWLQARAHQSHRFGGISTMNEQMNLPLCAHPPNYVKCYTWL